MFGEMPTLDGDEMALHAVRRACDPCDVGPDFADADARADCRPAASDGSSASASRTTSPLTLTSRAPDGSRTDPRIFACWRPTSEASTTPAPSARHPCTPQGGLGEAVARPERPRRRPQGGRHRRWCAPHQRLHLVIGQMHVVFIALHNRLVEGLREYGTSRPTASATSCAAIWH